MQNFIEPFFGSGAVLLGRPHPPHIETVNDKDGFVANFYRALQHKPDEVAHYADWPVNENDLHARHAWLVPRREGLTARLEGDPDYYDAKIAGWWVWGLCCWIGSGWCSGQGPWQRIDGQLVHLGNAGQGIRRQLVHLGNAGQGIRRQIVHLGDAGQGIHRQRVHLGNAGQGIHRQRVHLGNAGQGEAGIAAWFAALAERLRRVRVCCGDWAHVLGPSVMYRHGLTGIVLDPPYSHTLRNPRLYVEDSDISSAVKAWALAHGNHPLLRIVLCGYTGEHDMPGWQQVSWVANGGMGNSNRQTSNTNRHKETLWLSPHCVPRNGQLSLFSDT